MSYGKKYPQPGDKDFKEILAHKIYVGNINPTATDLDVLQLLKQYGAVRKLDFLYDALRKPRGYCFCEYVTRQDAERAQSNLDGLLFMERNLAAKFAKNKITGQAEMPNRRAHSTLAAPIGTLSGSDKIKAIEAKLKAMEHEAANPAPSSSARAMPAHTPLPHGHNNNGSYGNNSRGGFRHQGQHRRKDDRFRPY
eukprot:Opistho-2@91670